MNEFDMTVRAILPEGLLSEGISTLQINLGSLTCIVPVLASIVLSILLTVIINIILRLGGRH